jgi:hypothetical protein
MPAELTLTSDPFTIAPPYGLDTYILLVSEQPLPDPGMLEFEAVSGTRGRLQPTSQDPLSRVLSQFGRGTRGVKTAVPTNWSIDRLVFHSTPQSTE